MIVTQEKINDDINSAFSYEEYTDEKRRLAQHIMAIGMDWCNNQPKNFNNGSLSKGEIRKRKRENHKALHKHIQEQLDKDVQAAKDNHAVGFLGIGFLILCTILTGVIQWVVKRLLDNYFD